MSNAGSAQDQLSSPSGVAVGSNGSRYVVDSNNNRVQKVDVDGGVTTVVGGNAPGSAANDLARPFGIAIASQDALYIGGWVFAVTLGRPYDQPGFPAN